MLPLQLRIKLICTHIKISRGTVCTGVTSEQLRDMEFIILLLFILFCSCNYQDKVFTKKNFHEKNMGVRNALGPLTNMGTLVDIPTKIIFFFIYTKILFKDKTSKPFTNSF